MGLIYCLLFITVDTMERKSGHDPEKDLADQYFQEFIGRFVSEFWHFYRLFNLLPPRHMSLIILTCQSNLTFACCVC